ncbi:CDP-alcohol phosphatidyltransferase family protein, partial [Streptomyces sp. NPDC059346]
MRTAADAGDAAALLAAVPAGRRVALVDPRFVGHVHALRLGLTDPRFPAATVPGALTARPEARGALLRALRRTATAVGAGAPVVDPDADPAPEDRTVPG